MLMYNFEETYPRFKKLERHVSELRRYVERNAWMIQNYGRRWRAGQRISTAFVEAEVNLLLKKRFAKKQQMQWTKRGAHLLIQIRARVLNGDLSETFRRWYPDFQASDAPLATAA